jgi:hypothetical protein
MRLFLANPSQGSSCKAKLSKHTKRTVQGVTYPPSKLTTLIRSQLVERVDLISTGALLGEGEENWYMKCAREKTKVHAKCWRFRAGINRADCHRSLSALSRDPYRMLNMKRIPISRVIYIGNVGAIVLLWEVEVAACTSLDAVLNGRDPTLYSANIIILTKPTSDNATRVARIILQ